ncbi:MAG: hypothetical protein WBM11_09160, partial [Terriglobales bacterium]
MKIQLCLLVLLLAAVLHPRAMGQSYAGPEATALANPPSALPGAGCSPAPCVLPPTAASNGTYPDIFAPVSANPKNPKELIVGSMDANCGISTQVGFHVSNDAGTTWSTTCLTYFSEFGRTWEPGNLPLVGYDLRGRAYIAGYYQDTDTGEYSLMGIETSTDGVTWSTPTAAVGNGVSDIFWA